VKLGKEHQAIDNTQTSQIVGVLACALLLALCSPAAKETETAAAALGIHLRYIEIGSPINIEPAFREAVRDRADAVLVLNSPVLNSRRGELAELAIKSRLPTAYGQGEYVQAGGVMSYGPNIVELFRRTGAYVDKILKGAKPSELPVQQPKTFEFIINLKTAKQIGLTIPPPTCSHVQIG
jgi:ABC-type uncharacterized transport system substrate-binding protein